MSGGEIVVHVAEYKVGGAGDVLLTIGLGSCVAVALHDSEARVGGLAHILLPSPALSRRDQSPGKFPQTAIPLLMQDMVARGARGVPDHGADRRRRLACSRNLQPAGHDPDGRAQPRGGARGARPHHSVPLVGSAVGGDFGRTVRLFVERWADGSLHGRARE